MKITARENWIVVNGKSMQWWQAREAAAQVDPQLRAIYAEILAEARRLTADLRRCRLANGAVVGHLAAAGWKAEEDRPRLAAICVREGWGDGSDLAIVWLDPDEVADEERLESGQRRVNTEIDLIAAAARDGWCR